MKVYVVIESWGDGYGHGDRETVGVYVCEKAARHEAAKVQEQYRSRDVEEHEVKCVCEGHE